MIRPVEVGTVVAEGRAIGYRCFGAEPSAARTTVLYCHGGLSCSSDASLGDYAARLRDVSIVAVDRPGVGGSAPLPGRNTASFADDIAAVLDNRGISATGGVVGWSLGGQYALAAGALLADKVAAVAVVAGVPPLSWPGVRRSLSPTDRLLLRSVRDRAPSMLSHALFAMVGRQARRSAARRSHDGARPGRVLQRIWGSADAAVLARPVGALIDDAVAEATKSVGGMREEYRAWERPWGFDPGNIAVPVTVWQGDNDRWVPMALAEQLVAATPGAHLHPCPGQGHLLLSDRWGDVLDCLLDAVG